MAEVGKTMMEVGKTITEVGKTMREVGKTMNYVDYFLTLAGRCLRETGAFETWMRWLF